VDCGLVGCDTVSLGGGHLLVELLCSVCFPMEVHYMSFEILKAEMSISGL
jgi:hypothetical protein